jgi:hypothetical protein
MTRIFVACIALGLLSLDVLGQGRAIYGTVTDSLFHPIPDVNVRLADGSAGARTDEKRCISTESARRWKYNIDIQSCKLLFQTNRIPG